MSNFINLPLFYGPGEGTLADFGTTFDNLGDLFGFHVQIPENDEITQLGLRLHAKTGSPGTLRMYLEKDSSKYTDISDWASISVDSIFVGNLTSPITLNRGELTRFIVDPISGTFNASNSIGVTTHINNFASRDFPRKFNLGGFSAPLTQMFPFVLRSATKSYGFPISALGSESATTGGTYNELGMSFKIPNQKCKTFKVSGIKLRFQILSNMVGSINLYKDRTLLQTADFRRSNTPSGGTNTGEFYFILNELVTLEADTEYIISIRNTTNNSCLVVYFDVPEERDKSAFGAENLNQVKRQGNTSAWTVNSTRLMTMYPIISETSVSANYTERTNRSWKQ